jgi:hypothetical protein
MRNPKGSFYEIRCQRCDVSFPPETKVCVHCGERIRPQRQVLTSVPALEDVFQGIMPADALAGKSSSAVLPDSPGMEIPEDPSEAIEEEEQPRFSKSRLLGNLVWIVLAVLASVFQVCRGG